MTERNSRIFGAVLGCSVVGALLAGGAGLVFGGLVGAFIGVNLPRNDG